VHARQVRRLLGLFMADKPTQMILRSAAEVVGGANKLANALHVPREELDAWIMGRADPPPGALMDAVDLATFQAQLKDLPPS
jgi:DNA-binding transcriptional regulator YdaS (Cro superfamily)